MQIRFKCPHCKKTLRVNDSLAGRKTGCPACRKPIVIPRPKPKTVPEEVEKLAAEMFGDGPAKPPEPEPVAKPIKFNCEFCDTAIEVPLSEAGKKIPCPDPECRRIIRVPVPEEDKPKDWRDLIKKGPSAALINQPEQLENAWGTEQKARVSQGSLQEAGAVPEVAVPPVGIFGWTKRIFWTAAVIGLVFLAGSGMRRTRAERQEKEAIEDARRLIDQLSKEPEGKELGPIATAEIYRAAGELYCAKRKVDRARKDFQLALAMAKNADPNSAGLDVDLFLIELALAQIELGGNEQEKIAKERIDWPDALKDIGKTLENINAEPARAMALRTVCTRLGEKKQQALAISLAGQAGARADRPGQPSILVAQQVALLLAQKTEKDEKQAETLIPRPKEKGVIDPIARGAYVEGLVRRGQFKEALDLAQAKSVPIQDLEPQQRMEASVGAALAILADRTRPKPAEEALPFLQNALAAHKDCLKENKKYAIPPWLQFQLVQAGTCIGSPKEEAECKSLAQPLDRAFRQHLDLTCLRLKLAKADTAMRDDPTMADTKGLPWSLAWENIARLNARLGSSQDEILNLSADNRLKPFLLAGFALGKHDREK